MNLFERIGFFFIYCVALLLSIVIGIIALFHNLFSWFMAMADASMQKFWDKKWSHKAMEYQSMGYGDYWVRARLKADCEDSNCPYEDEDLEKWLDHILNLSASQRQT